LKEFLSDCGDFERPGNKDSIGIMVLITRSVIYQQKPQHEKLFSGIEM
jgi:hypothetical protein